MTATKTREASVGWHFNGTVFQIAGQQIVVSNDGNNVAFNCVNIVGKGFDQKPCGQAVLLVYRNGRDGSASTSRSVCPACGREYYLDPQYTDPPPEPPAGQPQQRAAVMNIV